MEIAYGSTEPNMGSKDQHQRAATMVLIPKGRKAGNRGWRWHVSGSSGSANTQSFTIDAKTIAEIEKLKEGLGASSVPEVIQRALGLAKLAVDNADKATGIVKIGSGDIDLKK